MNQHKLLHDQLRAENPVTMTRELDARAVGDLKGILATPQQAPAPRTFPAPTLGRAALPRPRWAIAGLVAAVLAIAVIALMTFSPGGGGQTAYAATPDQLTVLGDDAFAAAGLSASASAPELLRTIAERAAGAPDDTGQGMYARIRTESWNLFTRIDGERVSSEVVPQTLTSWTAPDGSGKSVTALAFPGGKTDITTVEGGAGSRALMWPLGSLSSDPVTLADQLGAEHPASNGPAERLVAVADLTREQPIKPPVRAAVLRYLAETPGLSTTGMVTDRAGRTGLAVHVDSSMGGLPERRTVIIDPSDGRVLGTETMLTTTAGELNVRAPSVISYTSYLEAAYVGSLD
ncbi:CU044_5270 family protein [Modestobacter sp. VKM Ac-2983]|uniref:CU044_5270 family protein n=1 Tax=Modestobacter sp. VKM Ac-2983 TaxID=3004137 RepID=UPI0022AB67AF|nr:CU044_5270 family protein [Modestobacter sp. VKM Ac-2983]MCZ2803572.1 CU044_5270 family protein [Modestobacter sp. VKM Ac-2983]